MEGVTEQIGDVTFTCVGSGGPANIQLFFTPALPVTSEVLTAGTTGYTEALAITGSGSVQGVVDPSGTSITFTGVTIPAGATSVTITNVRVSPASIATGSGGLPPPVREVVFLSGIGVQPAVFSPITVGLVLNGLGPQSLTNVTTNLVGCVTQPPVPAFVVRFGEGFSTAFKQRGSAAINGTLGAWAALNTETGFVPAAWADTAGASNLANSATRIRIVLSNVPANVVVYFPTSPLTDQTGAGTLALTGSETGPLAPFSPITPNAANGLPATPGLAPAGGSGGTVEGVYEVTMQSPGILETYTIPVYFAWTANSVTGSNTPIGVSVSFAPAGATSSTPAVVPSFAVGNSTTPFTAGTIGLCATSLLFPFVTNELGFDTALIISNTSADPLGANGAVEQSGTCNLNFYGLGTPTPSTNVLAPNGNGAGGAYLSGQTYIFTASDVAIGFQGYVIVACNFNYAHGYASITYSPGLPSSTAMGYKALVLNRTAGTVESDGN